MGEREGPNSRTEVDGVWEPKAVCGRYEGHAGWLGTEAGTPGLLPGGPSRATVQVWIPSEMLLCSRTIATRAR